jgi:hypothetical protein
MRIRGYVDTCSIIQPLNINNNLEYKLRLHPESYLFNELEEGIKKLQEDWLIQQPPSNPDTPPIPPTNIIDGCVINLQTIRKPQLIGSLSKLDKDENLYGKFVQAVGHLQIQMLGNCFLSFHILEPYGQDK